MRRCYILAHRWLSPSILSFVIATLRQETHLTPIKSPKPRFFPLHTTGRTDSAPATPTMAINFDRPIIPLSAVLSCSSCLATSWVHLHCSACTEGETNEQRKEGMAEIRRPERMIVGSSTAAYWVRAWKPITHPGSSLDIKLGSKAPTLDMWGSQPTKPCSDTNSEEGFSRVENGLEVQLCRFLRQNNDLIGFGASFDWAHDIEVNSIQGLFAEVLAALTSCWRRSTNRS
jgi:hypothetical protein